MFLFQEGSDDELSIHDSGDVTTTAVHTDDSDDGEDTLLHLLLHLQHGTVGVDEPVEGVVVELYQQLQKQTPRQKAVAVYVAVIFQDFDVVVIGIVSVLFRLD